jgi:hypothetical protein
MRILTNLFKSPAGAEFIVVFTALILACAGARPYAGSWNDSSRLATTESIVDYQTLAIDHSIFAQGFDSTTKTVPAPFPTADEGLLEHGTLDKLYINGHFYSDKPQVHAVLMAGLYQVWEWCGGPPARVRPDQFCILMTVATAGLAYVLAVWCIYRIGLKLQLSVPWSFCLAGSFALATVAPVYAEQVNGHIVLLAVAAALLLLLMRLATEAETGIPSWKTMAAIGGLAGLGYTSDLGVGPLLVLTLLPLILSRTRHLGRLALCAACLLPWIVLHHCLNYAIGGTLKPANSVPEYFNWPGSPFDAGNLTGAWNHSPGHFLVYAAALLFGKRGFVTHNLPLFLLLPGIFILYRYKPRMWREAAFSAAWSGGTWFLYAALSTNYSGPCCSIRWFVPLLAPAYFLIGLLLKECPGYRQDFLLLSGWGLCLASIMCWKGPWMQTMVPGFWLFPAGALLSWAAWRRHKFGMERSDGHVTHALAGPLAGAAGLLAADLLAKADRKPA